jgi:hypothetical protein
MRLQAPYSDTVDLLCLCCVLVQIPVKRMPHVGPFPVAKQDAPVHILRTQKRHAVCAAPIRHKRAPLMPADSHMHLRRHHKYFKLDT